MLQSPVEDHSSQNGEVSGGLHPKEEPQKEEDVHFSWSQEIDKYGDKLLKRLDEFRKSNSMYDVKLKANDTTFNAHKIVLAACGGMFRYENNYYFVYLLYLHAV